jgi:hypothetical protein
MKQFWTEQELAKLTELYPVTPMKKLEQEFSRSAHKIYNKAFALGLKKDDEYLKTYAGRFTGHLSEKSIKHQFKKGSVPFNKGMKGWSAKGTEATRFKKGTRPPNYKPVGTIRETRDGYFEMKIAEGMYKWRLLHRVVWERLNGAIPKGMNLIFLDGNTKNIEITNLSLVTKRQNMLRNTVHNYPPEIVHLVQMKAAINRQINKREGKNEQHGHA